MVTMIVNKEIVSKEYEKSYNDFLNTLRSSNTKSKDLDEEKINWVYSFSYFKSKGEYTEEYYEKLYNMTYDERLKEELKKVRVNLTLVANHFRITDRIQGVSPIVEEAVKQITKQKMIDEQEKIQNDDVIKSIPENENIKPLSLEEQLEKAIETEDYMGAARLRDELKKES